MSTIEWTDETWNPTLGCDRVSPGCDNCYAIRSSRVRSGNPHPAVARAHAGLTIDTGTRLDWTGKVRSLPDRLDVPLRWRKPRRVFVDSMSDLFHDDVPDGFIWSVFVTMAQAPRHTFQVLTKRHGRLRSLLGRWAADGWMARDHRLSWNDLSRHLVNGVLPNVWLGVSVEDQKRADLRIPALLETPAAVRFLSCEPLLGPLDLVPWLAPQRGCEQCDVDGRCECPWEKAVCLGEDVDPETGGQPARTLDWVIAGGESGPGARPIHPDWARSLRDQCVAAGTAFHFKQWGAWAPAPWVVRPWDRDIGWQGTADDLAMAKADAEARGATHAIHPGGSLYEPPHKPWSVERTGLPKGVAGIHRVGKKAAGRQLDDRTWDEFPHTPVVVS